MRCFHTGCIKRFNLSLRSSRIVRLAFFAISIVLFSSPGLAETVLFEDPFRSALADGWFWKRENPEMWRVAGDAIEIRIEPGNMWGGDNDARNVLYRPLPPIETGSLTLTCKVENEPSSQYEQVDLVWYHDDSHMVKIGMELVDGQRSIVMGREEDDKTKTIRIIPMPSSSVYLQLNIKGDTIDGRYRVAPTDAWQDAGTCELPAKGKANASIQCYQGSTEIEHWARISEFKIIHEED